MPDIITISGTVATTPSTVKTDRGLAITHFRLASNNRRYDGAAQQWVDGDANFYTVSAFRQTAHNVLASFQVGDRVVVTGRLKLKEWTNSDRRGVTAEIDVDAIGHDLTWGSTRLTKVSRSNTRDTQTPADAFPSAAELASVGAEISSPERDVDDSSSTAEDGRLPTLFAPGYSLGGAGQPAANDLEASEVHADTAQVDSEGQYVERGSSQVDVERSASDQAEVPTPF
jgi:single-strand DNA-binding protein